MSSGIGALISVYPFGEIVEIHSARMSKDIDGNFIGVVQIQAGDSSININFDDELVIRDFCEKHNIEVTDYRKKIKAVK